MKLMNSSVADEVEVFWEKAKSSIAAPSLWRIETNFNTSEMPVCETFRKVNSSDFQIESYDINPRHTWVCCLVVFTLKDTFQLSQDESKSWSTSTNLEILRSLWGEVYASDMICVA